MKPTDNIKKLVAQLKDTTGNDLDQRILNDIFAAMDNTKQHSAQTLNIWRIIMKSKITKFAAAAVVIIAVGLSITLLDKTVPTAYALEQTAEALKKVHNVHGIWIDRKGRRVNSWGKIDPDTGKISKMRLEYEDGGLYIIANGHTYLEDDGIIAFKEEEFMRSGLIFNNFIEVLAQNIKVRDEAVIQKQFSEEFQREVIVVDVKQPRIHVQVVLDTDTKRPIKFSVPWAENLTEPLDHTELIEYDVDLPADTFDFEITPDTLILGKDLARKLLNDPAIGMVYDDEDGLQQVCKEIAKEFLQAEIDRDFETIKQLHPYYPGHYGSSKYMEKHFDRVETHNGRIVEILSFAKAYEYENPKTMLIPCKVVREYKGQRKDQFVGIYVYLRNHDGEKSAVVSGSMFPLSKDMIK